MVLDNAFLSEPGFSGLLDLQDFSHQVLFHKDNTKHASKSLDMVILVI